MCYPCFSSQQSNISWIDELHPNVCVWEVTLACNMRCIHCGSSASPLTKRSDELNTREALDIINQLKDIGTQRVIFSGGEPFLREDWETLAKEVVRQQMTLGFVSNGFLMSENVAKRIKKLNRYDTHVSLSIDGNEKIHDYIRQTKGSFKRVTQAMEILRNKGVHTSVITQVNKINFKLLPDIRNHIFKYDIYCWQIQMAAPLGRLRENPKLLISPENFVELTRFIVEQRKMFGEKIVAADNIGYYTELESRLRPKEEWHGCHAGLRNIGITSNGGVTGCLSLQEQRFIEANVRSRKLKDVWHDPTFASYNRNFRKELLEGYCKECQHGQKCQGGCKHSAYSFSGSLHNNFYCVFRIGLGKTPKDIKIIRISDENHYHP